MAKKVMRIPDDIKSAIDEITMFESVIDVGDAVIDEQVVIIETTWKVNLPNAFKRSGISTTGVKESERVYWRFPIDYPTRAPTPRLRVDFPTNIPHLNPHNEGELVFPCVSEIPLIDLLHSAGLQAILTITKQWLDNTAADELHCPVQGWEYVRRDEQGIVLTNTFYVRNELSSKLNTVRYFEYRYLKPKVNNILIGSLLTPHLGSANSTLKKIDLGIAKYNGIHTSLAVLFQTDKDAVFNEYRPESVCDVKSLREFVDYLGLTDAFETRVNYILSLQKPIQKFTPVDEFLVILAIKRPFNLIGVDSPYELLPYRVKYRSNKQGFLDDTMSVYPVCFMERCCPALLKSVSGNKYKNNVTKITLLGSGSLGSKLGLHLAKSGVYQFELVDNKFFSSHNNARHGLVVVDFDKKINSKVDLLEREISKLGVKVKAINSDIKLLGKLGGFNLNSTTNYIVDTTASLSVRYFLAHQCTKLPGQLIHSLMYGKAKMGVVAIEGVERNVRIDDLMAYTNACCLTDTLVQDAMYGASAPNIQFYGEGCSSMTTTMDDIDLSLMSTAITSNINKYITKESSKDRGRLNIGHITQETLNMQWQSHELSPTVVIQKDNSFKWEIRVIGSIANEIVRQSKINPTVENGGILVGQICQLSKTIYITHLLDAPIGSFRSASRFDLNTEGLAELFDDIHNKTNAQVTFLGTWHSHTKPTPPSGIDKDSLRKLQANYDLPIVMLTYTGGRIVRVTE